MKQILLAKGMKELQDDMHNKHAQNRRVSKLIARLKYVKFQHHYDVYKILKEIYIIRKSQIKSYKIIQLASEKDMPYNEAQVRYFLGYDKASEFAKKMIKENKITCGRVLYVIRKGQTDYGNNHFNQNAVFKALLDKKITLKHVGLIQPKTLLKMIRNNDCNNLGIDASAKLLQKLRRLEQYTKLFKSQIHDKRIKSYMLTAAKSLLKNIRQIKVRGR